MATKEAVWANNNGSANDHFEWGPNTITDVYKLLRVQIDISFGFIGAAAPPASYFYAAHAWGVQYVTSGSSPLTIPANLSSYQFLIADLTIADSVGVAAWAPSTDTGEVITFATLHREWYGQRIIEGDIDLWVSYAQIVGSGSDIVASWLYRVDWV